MSTPHRVAILSLSIILLTGTLLHAQDVIGTLPVRPGPSAADSALIELGRRAPDSAAQYALAHWHSLDGWMQGRAVDWIAGSDGSRLPRLIPLLSAPYRSESFSIEYELGRKAKLFPAATDSLARGLFVSPHASVRVLAMRVAADPFMDRAATLEGRRLLSAGAEDRDAEVRRAAYMGIGTTVEMDSTALEWGRPLLIHGLDDRDDGARVHVVYGMQRSEIRIRGGAERFRRMARSGSVQLRVAAIRGLALYSDTGGSVTADLVGYLQDPTPAIVQSSFDAFTSIARRGGRLPPSVVHATRDYVAREDNPYFRLDGVRALAAMRDTAGLASLVTDQDEIVASGSLRLLARLAPTAPAALAAYEDPRPSLRSAAIEAMVPLALAGTPLVMTTPSGRAAVDSAHTIARGLRKAGVDGKCFQLSWTSFQPVLDIGEDTIYSLPPRIIAFQSGPSMWSGSNGYSAMIAPANGTGSTGHRFGYWIWNDSTRTIDGGWSTGFSGVNFRVAVSGTEFVGELWPFWDFPRAGQVAQLTMRPVTCVSVMPVRAGVDDWQYY